MNTLTTRLADCSTVSKRSEYHDNTVVIYIAGDNGMSAEGGLAGTLNEMAAFNGVPDTTAKHPQSSRRDRRPQQFSAHSGGMGARGRYAFPMDQAGRLALRRHAQRHGDFVAGAASRMRAASARQWHHVIDITPTILEAAKLPQPKTVDGIKQKPMEGVSMVYSFANAKAPTRHTTQYFEMFGNRGIYPNGWTAVTRHRIPWETGMVARNSPKTNGSSTIPTTISASRRTSRRNIQTS